MNPPPMITSLLVAVIALGGITACQSGSSEVGQSDAQIAPTATASPSSAPSATAQPSDSQSRQNPSSNTARSPEQMQQRMQQRQAMRQQIEAVLTPEQLKQLETQLQQGKRMRQAIASLDLSADQKAKIQAIWQQSRPQRPPASPQKSE